MVSFAELGKMAVHGSKLASFQHCNPKTNSIFSLVSSGMFLGLCSDSGAHPLELGIRGRQGVVIDHIPNTRMGEKFLGEYEGANDRDKMEKHAEKLNYINLPLSTPGHQCKVLCEHRRGHDQYCFLKEFLPIFVKYFTQVQVLYVYLISLIIFNWVSICSSRSALHLLCAPRGWLIWMTSMSPLPSSWISSWDWPMETRNCMKREGWVGIFIFQAPLIQDCFRLSRSLHQRWCGLHTVTLSPGLHSHASLLQAQVW